MSDSPMDKTHTFEQSKLEAVNQLAAKGLQYLQDKYQKPFQIASLTEGNIISNQQQLRVYAEGDDPEDSMAVLFSRDYGAEFADDYFGVLIRADYEARVSALLDGIFDEKKVFCGGFMEETFHPDLGAGKTLDDALVLEQSMTGILYIYTQDTSKRALGSRAAIEERFRQAGYTALVKVIVLHRPRLDGITRENFRDMVPYYRDKENVITAGILDFYVGQEGSALPEIQANEQDREET